MEYTTNLMSLVNIIVIIAIIILGHAANTLDVESLT